MSAMLNVPKTLLLIDSITLSSTIGNDYKKTEDRKIFIANESSVEEERFSEFMDKILNFTQANDEEMCIRLLNELIKID